MSTKISRLHVEREDSPNADLGEAPRTQGVDKESDPEAWRVRALGDGAIVDTGRVQFARAFRTHAVNMNTADAHLIAAAPILLRALKALLIVGEANGVTDRRVLDLARLAIRRAEHRTVRTADDDQ